MSNKPTLKLRHHRCKSHLNKFDPSADGSSESMSKNDLEQAVEPSLWRIHNFALA